MIKLLVTVDDNDIYIYISWANFSGDDYATYFGHIFSNGQSLEY